MRRLGEASEGRKVRIDLGVRHFHPAWLRGAIPGSQEHIPCGGVMRALSSADLQALLKTGATGLEPATSGVTGRSWPLQAGRG